jgi:hypothetical protein
MALRNLVCGLVGASTLILGASQPWSAPQGGAPSAGATQERWSQAELEGASRAIEVQIEALRGERFKGPVTVRVASREDLIEYIRVRTEKSADEARLAADERIAKLLGVLPPELDLAATQLEFLAAQVAGYYDPDTDSFALMDSCPRDMARIVMAHELAHALDDQLYDIDGTLERIGSDTDRVLAFQAVVEGSGTSVMNRWTIQHSDTLDAQVMLDAQKLQLQSLAEAPAWLWRPTFAAYMQGLAFLQRTDNWVAAQVKSVENADIAAAFAKPPSSTEQVLHPERYWDPKRLDEPLRVAFEVGELPAGWSVQREDTLGELALSIVACPDEQRGGLSLEGGPMALLGIKFTHDVARGWGGDRVILLGRAEGGSVLRWVTVWDSERDAAEFYGAMQMRLPSLVASARKLAGGDAGLCDATLEYGGDAREVELVVRAGAKGADARKALRAIRLVK